MGIPRCVVDSRAQIRCPASILRCPSRGTVMPWAPTSEDGAAYTVRKASVGAGRVAPSDPARVAPVANRSTWAGGCLRLAGALRGHDIDRRTLVTPAGRLAPASPAAGGQRPRPVQPCSPTARHRGLAAQGGPSRILMLTAAGAVDDRVEGLNLGADDYLSKPFAFNELVARVRALGRRSSPVAPPVLTLGDLVLDQAKRAVTRGGKTLDLTRKEFGILEELIKARGG